LPFANNQIPTSRLDPAAQSLMNLFPQPNQAGDRQNFHTVTTTTSELDDVNVRFVRAFGAAAQPGQGRGGGRFGGGFGGRGGGGLAGGSNLNVNIHYRHSDASNASPFPALGGSSVSSAWDVPAAYSFTKAGMLHAIRFQFNRQHSATQNLYAFDQNVAGAAGLGGVATDPFDWGATNVSLSSFTGLRDLAPATRTDRTLAIGDSVVKTRGRQTLRFGGDYRDVHADANARGTFVFSGLYTGVDFGDFLLGLPQQSTVQFGPGTEQFRSRSWDVFAQDDWRATDSLTVNAGVRYEYYSPVSEAANRLVTLDVAPDFTAAAPVIAGGTGPYSGAFGDTIVRPFRGGVAPRIGIAWRARPGTVVRAGYGINEGGTRLHRSPAVSCGSDRGRVVLHLAASIWTSPRIARRSPPRSTPTAEPAARDSRPARRRRRRAR
jgi:trimeric autotransporter adhesin